MKGDKYEICVSNEAMERNVSILRKIVRGAIGTLVKLGCSCVSLESGRKAGAGRSSNPRLSDLSDQITLLQATSVSFNE
jgi:hypothetical protein